MSCLGKLIVVMLPELGSVDAMALAFRGTWVRGVWPVGKSTGLRFLCREALSYPLIPTFMLIYSHTCSRTHTHLHTLPDTLAAFVNVNLTFLSQGCAMGVLKQQLSPYWISNSVIRTSGSSSVVLRMSCHPSYEETSRLNQEVMSPQTHSGSVKESDPHLSAPFRSGRSYPNLARNVSWSALELGDLPVHCQSGYLQPLPVSRAPGQMPERDAY